MEELIARLNNLLRRVAGAATGILEVGPLRIDTRRLAVVRDGREIDLTPLEFSFGGPAIAPACSPTAPGRARRVHLRPPVRSPRPRRR